MFAILLTACSSSGSLLTPPPAAPTAATAVVGAGTPLPSVDAPRKPATPNSVGARVTWTNREPRVQHTVTADDGSFGSDPASTGSSFSHVFTIAGTYSYHCSIHPDMTGIVIVTG